MHGVRPGSGRTSKETIMAETPVNPGNQVSPEPQTAAPAATYQPVAPAFQPVAAPTQTFGSTQQTVAPVKQGGSGALKIILIILGVFVVLIMLVVGVVGYGVWKVAHSVRVNSSNGAVSLNGSGLSMNSAPGMTFTAEELGTEIYPGATPAKNGNMRMSIAGNSVVTAVFVTSDPTAKVVDFYKGKLGSDATSMDFGGTALLTVKKGDKEQVTVTVTQQGNQSGGTRIQIQHTTATQK
jgi:hypothetical protein